MTLREHATDQMISIRTSTPEDSDRAIEIWRASVNATHDFLSEEDRAAIDLEVCDFLPQTELWLAVDESQRSLGFMILDAPKVEGLFIDPAARGSGVGRALIAHASTFDPELTVDVNEQNPQAIGFYEHLGFIATGRSEVDDA